MRVRNQLCTTALGTLLTIGELELYHAPDNQYVPAALCHKEPEIPALKSHRTRRTKTCKLGRAGACHSLGLSHCLLSSATGGCHLRVLDSLDIMSSIMLTKLRARSIGRAVDV